MNAMLVIIALLVAPDKDLLIHLVPLYLCIMELFVLLVHNVKMDFTATLQHCQKKLC